MLKRYVLGFAFDPYLHNVTLIRKTRPEWQKDRMNGVGGHIEEGELSCEAMRREFGEETGTQEDIHWVQYAVLHGVDWEVDIYRAILDTLPHVAFTTEEGVIWQVPVTDLKNWPVLPNLLYLIPMAINHIQGTDKCKYFDIREVE
jgi:8-oxo-dGTP diphosphatase